MDKATVATPGKTWQKRSLIFELICDLLGGTAAMRAAGEKWLPKEPSEARQVYNGRLNRSILYGAFKDTIKRLTSKPFSKPVTIDGNLPELLEAIRWDVDRTGKDLDEFAREAFSSSLKYGWVGALVDYPRMQRGATIADEKAAGARPTFVLVEATQLLGFKMVQDEQTGHHVLDEVRIHESMTETDGAWGEKETERVRVYKRDTWEIWTKSDNEGEWVKSEEGPHTFGRVPFDVFYTNRAGYLDADPPLEDLAWLNLAHWQSLSDQRNLLRFVRCGILFAKGFSQEEVDNGIVIGPNNIVSSTNGEAVLSYVEHSGKGLDAGADDISALEERMEVMGLQPLISRTAKSTATGKVLDESRSSTDIMAWIDDEQAWLRRLFEMAGQWTSVVVPDDFSISIFRDFGIGHQAQEQIKSLTALRQSGDITRRTLLKEVKRRGLLHDELDVEEELEAIESEGPSIGGIGVTDESE